MHPSYITSSKGNLKAGNTFTLQDGNSLTVSTETIGISGDKSYDFIKGGAVGWKLYYPLGIKFSSKRLVWSYASDPEPEVPANPPEDDKENGATEEAAPCNWKIHRVK